VVLKKKNEGLHVEGTDGVRFRTNKIAQPVGSSGSSADEAVTNPFSDLDTVNNLFSCLVAR
jgi:hypothetical protein